MSAFKDTDEAERFLGAAWERIGAAADLGPKLESVNSTMRAIHTEPRARSRSSATAAEGLR